ncbi:uncharacterized protein NPIL_285491 [Nephila pilipes]|uniref:Uncharacterized protein n=1 Tax=Nephila pilipes TaxID=299642 RepID=A0A8X6NPF5_NEPPI|nr:uncharacterized protein NPIL_285491 [Nephila pilipes]
MGNETSCLGHCGKQNETPMQITITSSIISNKEHPVCTNENGLECIRCGSLIEKTKSVFVNIHPPVFQAKKQSTMSLEIQSKCTESGTSLESITESSCRQCGLPYSLHVSKTSKSHVLSDDSFDTSQGEPNIPNITILDPECSEEEIATDVLPEEHIKIIAKPHFQQGKSLSSEQFLFQKQVVSHPCVDCHVAVLNEESAQCLHRDQNVISLILQVPRTTTAMQSIECQTEQDVSKTDCGVSANFLDIYPDINIGKLWHLI